MTRKNTKIDQPSLPIPHARFLDVRRRAALLMRFKGFAKWFARGMLHALNLIARKEQNHDS